MDIHRAEIKAMDYRDNTTPAIRQRNKKPTPCRIYKSRPYWTVGSFRKWLKRDASFNKSLKVNDVNKYQDQAERFGGS